MSADLFIDINLYDDQLWGQLSGQSRKKLYPQKEYLYTIEDNRDSVLFYAETVNSPRGLTVIQKQGKVPAVKLGHVSEEDQKQYCGTYYNAEQKAYYKFSISKGNLFFKTGKNPKEAVSVLKKYDMVIFNYKNLEKAYINFRRNQNGDIDRFTLSSGRVSEMVFLKNK